MENYIEGTTPAHYAVENRDYDYLSSLEKKQLKVVDCEGESLLHYATSNYDTRMCDFLLTLEPELFDIKSNDGKTPCEMLSDIKNEEFDSEYYDMVVYYMDNYCTCINCMCGKRKCYICGQGEYPPDYEPCRLHGH